MKNLFNALCSLALTVITTGAIAQSETTFDKIRFNGTGAVELIQGENHSITSASGEKVPFTIDKNGMLEIEGNEWNRVTVTAPSITMIDLAGTGKLSTEGPFKVNDIELKVSGIGKIEMALEADKINATISGSGKLNLSGTANGLQIDITGAGRIDAESLKVKKCTANISGSGKCLLDVTEELNVNISGSGSVYYVKQPPVLNRNVTGMGKIGDASATYSDTTKVTFGKKKLWIIDDVEKSALQIFKDSVPSKPALVKSHWAGVELGINMLVDDEFYVTPPQGYKYLDLKTEKSIAVNLNFFDLQKKLYRRHIMLVTGFGATINNYRFKSQNYLDPGADSVSAAAIPVGVSIKKNKLVAGYITVPLLLEFNTSENPKKTVHLALGIIGGLRIGSYVKLVKEEGDKETKVRYINDYNLNPWRYDATLRLGFSNYTLFGSYNLAGLFKDDKGPGLHAFTAGVRVVGW